MDKIFYFIKTCTPIADTTPQVIPKSKPKELLIKQAELAIFGLSFEIFIGVIFISALIIANQYLDRQELILQ